MTNAELFKKVFGRYATEVWSMPETEFLDWLNEVVELRIGYRKVTNSEIIKAIVQETN